MIGLTPKNVIVSESEIVFAVCNNVIIDKIQFSGLAKVVILEVGVCFVTEHVIKFNLDYCKQDFIVV